MEVVQQALAVLLVFGLLALAVWKLRSGNITIPSIGARGNSRVLQTMERIALTPQHAVHLVRVQGREVVVLTHPQGCALLQGPGAGGQGPAGTEL